MTKFRPDWQRYTIAVLICIPFWLLKLISWLLYDAIGKGIEAAAEWVVDILADVSIFIDSFIGNVHGWLWTGDFRTLGIEDLILYEKQNEVKASGDDAGGDVPEVRKEP